MNRWRARGALFVFLLLGALTAFSGALFGQNLEIHYINVQQGQSTLVVGPNGTTILFDGGYETKGTSEVVPYLQSLGITASHPLDYIIASHRDTDHFVGLTEVMNYGYDAYHVYDNGSPKTNTYVEAFLTAAAAKTAGGVTALPLGTVINLGNGATATCVAVNGSALGYGAVSGATDENDRSICLLIKYNDFEFLLSGDMGGGSDDKDCTGRSTSQANMESPTVMAIMPAGAHPLLTQYGVEVAHVGHHGSESSTNADYMNLLTPVVACVAVGAGQSSNWYHPRIDVVEHVLLKGVPCISAPAALVLQTEEGSPTGATTSYAGHCVGDIVITSDGGNSYTVTASGAVSQGPDERAAAGLPATFYTEEYAAADNPPVVYAVKCGSIDLTSALVGWSTNEAATTLVRFGTVSGSYSETVTDASTVLNHSAALTGLTSATTYYYVVESTDATGHTTVSAEHSFLTTGGVVDTVTVLAPNGGESWAAGSSHSITWTSTGVVGSLDIAVSTDGGSNWTAVASGEANDGSYSWTVPGTVSTSCLVRVQEADGTPSDTSNAAFAITAAAESTVTVTSPNGGESWAVGSSHPITWTSTGTVGGLDIDVSTDGGSSWISLATGEANDGSYSWTVPDAVSATCRVRVQESDGTPTDSSDAVFAIKAATKVPGLVFSEVYYDTIGTDAVEEWIELYNNTTAAIDLGGYKITDNNGGSGTATLTIPDGTVIKPKSYLTIAANSAGFNALYGYDADLYGAVPALGNSGDALLLKDDTGILVDTVAWEGGTSAGVPDGWGSTSLPVAGVGKTLVRADVTSDSDTYADWTVAPSNGFPQTQLLSYPVVFSEVYYDTIGTDAVEEWIEFYNKAPIAVNIGGYQVVDNNGGSGTATYTVPAGTTLAPHSYLTVAANKAGFNALYGHDADLYGAVPALGNSGDALLLKDGQGILRDTVAWEGGTSAGVPAGWGSTSLPVASVGKTLVRSDVNVDTDTYADWTTAANNGNPEGQGDLLEAITLTSPVGGESWMASTSHDITWTSLGTVGKVTIDYSADGGASWLPVASGEANDGVFAWTVPETVSGTCLVRILENDGSPVDVSDAAFSIIAYVPEAVAAPVAPSGPASGLVGASGEFAIDGSASSYGDPVQYLIDWGDGTDSGWLAAGVKTASHGWAMDGSYLVRAKARCVLHPLVESAWSASLSVKIEDVSPDFDGDNRVDILWRNLLTGENRVWLMDGTAPREEINLPAWSEMAWAIVGTGDFDDDQKTDLLWRNLITGENRIWLMDGTTTNAIVDLDSQKGVTWTIAGCADFDGDAKTDILWRNTVTGVNRVWLMAGTTRTATVDLERLFGVAWAIAGTGDFNGDHKADILWRNAVKGTNRVWFMDGTTKSAIVDLPARKGVTWAIVGCGDFNGDGKTDLLWRDTVKGNNQIWLMDGTARTGTVDLETWRDIAWQVVN